VAGSEGAGIVVLNDARDTRAKLYTQYIPKKNEYRVHVVAGNVIDVTEKRKANDAEQRRNQRDPGPLPERGRPEPHQVRNTANGYVFCHEGVKPSPAVLDAGRKAVQALGLDFGAVDVIWNEKKQAAYVLEVNTAPGIAETSAKKYAEAFRKLAA
jgi:glutathione synthase/RimK-type ligase-like ATP-grasp enzyme